jgi:hypothetical protein
VQEGDTVTLPSFSTQEFAPDSFIFIVDSVRDALYNAETIQTVYSTVLPDTFSNPNTPNFYEVYKLGWLSYNNGVSAYTKSFGGLRGGVIPSEVLIDASVVLEYMFLPSNLHFKCYQDDALSIVIDSIYPNRECKYEPFLSINDAQLQEDPIVLYPNPGQDYFTINFNNQFYKNSALKLYNITGALVYNLPNTLGQSTVTIDVRTLPDGMYILRCTMDGLDYYKKVIIRK